MRILWDPPPDIRQHRNDTCWAAVLAAFFAVTPGRPKIDQFAIFEEFQHLCNSDHDKRIELGRMKVLFADHRFGLIVEEVSAKYFMTAYGFLFHKLKTGPMIVGYWEPVMSSWHGVLVYGLDGSILHFLNPDSESGGLLTNNIEYFCSKGNILVASRKW
jgi:hypothetical protein